MTIDVFAAPDYNPPVDPPPTETGPNDYFDYWSLDSHNVLSYSLRDDTQLNTLASTGNRLPGWSYDAILDAARGGVTNDYPADADITPQLWILNLTTSGTLTLVWDTRISSDWSDEPIPFVNGGGNRPGASVPNKAFQIVKPNNALHIETRFIPFKDSLPDIAGIDLRTYSGINGPGVSEAHNPNGYFSDTIQPLLAHWVAQGNTWMRHVEHIEINGLNDSGIDYNLFSLWLIDETRDAIQLYNKIPLKNQGGIDGFRFEYDASQQRAVGSPDKYIWNRNFMMFRGLIDPDITALISSKPIAA